MSERRDGTRRLYRIRAEGFRDLQAYFEQFWDSRLETLRVEAEREQRSDGVVPSATETDPIVREIRIDATPETVFEVLHRSRQAHAMVGGGGDARSASGRGVPPGARRWRRPRGRSVFHARRVRGGVAAGSCGVHVGLHQLGCRRAARLVHRRGHTDRETGVAPCCASCTEVCPSPSSSRTPAGGPGCWSA